MQTDQTMVAVGAQKVLAQVRKVVVGKDQALLWALATILARGHILLEDIPGVGKTTMAVPSPKCWGLHITASSSPRTCCPPMSPVTVCWIRQLAR